MRCEIAYIKIFVAYLPVETAQVTSLFLGVYMLYEFLNAAQFIHVITFGIVGIFLFKYIVPKTSSGRIITILCLAFAVLREIVILSPEDATAMRGT